MIKKRVFDGHSDVLYKLWKENDRQSFFNPETDLQSSYHKLKQGKVGVQTTAVFVPPEVPSDLKTYAALQMIDILHDEILTDARSKLLKNKNDLEQITPDREQLHILLSIEGAEPLQGDLTYLRTFYQLGVRSVGLTWNYRNEAADGVLEPKAGGLSMFGLALIEEMNRLHMAIDISHLALPGFWDCVEHSRQPIMASHCNAREIFDHPRNLYNDQIEAIFNMKGLVGINFVPYFTGGKENVFTTDVLKHVEHMLSLGGENYIGFGSDFDGISKTIHNLENATKWGGFIEELQKHYQESVVEKLLFHNWIQYYKRLWDGFTV